MTTDSTKASRVFTWLGLVCLVGVLFLFQDLGRAWLGTRAIGSQRGPDFGVSGWLDMSRAASPSRWLYIGAHVWLVAVLATWVRGTLPTRIQFVLLSLLGLGTLGIHALVLGPMRGWIIRPWLF